MNLVVIARRPELGEHCAAIISQLTGRHPSRTLICSPTDPDGPGWLDARITAHCMLPREDAAETCAETIYVTAGGETGRHLAAIVEPLLIHDLPVTVWWPGEPPLGSPQAATCSRMPTGSSSTARAGAATACDRPAPAGPADRRRPAGGLRLRPRPPVALARGDRVDVRPARLPALPALDPPDRRHLRDPRRARPARDDEHGQAALPRRLARVAARDDRQQAARADRRPGRRGRRLEAREPARPRTPRTRRPARRREAGRRTRLRGHAPPRPADVAVVMRPVLSGDARRARPCGSSCLPSGAARSCGSTSPPRPRPSRVRAWQDGVELLDRRFNAAAPDGGRPAGRGDRGAPARHRVRGRDPDGRPDRRAARDAGAGLTEPPAARRSAGPAAERVRSGRPAARRSRPPASRRSSSPAIRTRWPRPRRSGWPSGSSRRSRLRGRADIALTGGSTPAAMYRRLLDRQLRDRVDWSRVHLWWGDDRFVPRDDPLSNVFLADEALLGAGRHPDPAGQRPPVPDRRGDPDGLRTGLVRRDLRGRGRRRGAARRRLAVVRRRPRRDRRRRPPAVGLPGQPGARRATWSRWRSRPRPTSSPHVERVTLNPAILVAARRVLAMAAGAGQGRDRRAGPRGAARPDARCPASSPGGRARPGSSTRRPRRAWAARPGSATPTRGPGPPPSGDRRRRRRRGRGLADVVQGDLRLPATPTPTTRSGPGSATSSCPASETWLAIDPDGSIVGFMALGAGRASTSSTCARIGPGAASARRFIGLAKSLRPGGLELYTFQVNTGARRFYERHGFRVVDLDDGARNEEGQPDVRYRWLPVEPSRPVTDGEVGSTVSPDGTRIAWVRSGTRPADRARPRRHGRPHRLADRRAAARADPHACIAIDRRGRGCERRHAAVRDRPRVRGRRGRRRCDRRRRRAGRSTSSATRSAAGSVSAPRCSAPNLRRLVVYEGAPAPGGRSFHGDQVMARLEALDAADDREGLLAYFLAEVVGMPAADLEAYRDVADLADPGGATLRPSSARCGPRRTRMPAPSATRRSGSRSSRSSAATAARSSPTARGRSIGSCADGRVVIIPGARHAAHHTHPERFVAEVRAFLEGGLTIRA